MDRDDLMPNQHKTKSVTWHPSDPALKPRIEAEAGQRGITQRELLDEMAAEYFERVDFARSVDVSAVNREIAAELRGAARDTTQTTEETR
jgi:hypothetical protein